MTPGKIVTVDDKGTVGCVVGGATSSTIKVIVFQHRTGRWQSPAEMLLAAIGEPANDSRNAELAAASVKRHRGVVPCGGTFMRYVRVWPDGKPPEAS